MHEVTLPETQSLGNSRLLFQFPSMGLSVDTSRELGWGFRRNQWAAVGLAPSPQV